MYMVTIFCITASLLYADQNLMAPNLTAIAQSKFPFELVVPGLASVNASILKVPTPPLSHKLCFLFQVLALTSRNVINI